MNTTTTTMPSQPLAPPNVARTSVRPRRSAWTPARIGIYAFLLVCAVSVSYTHLTLPTKA